jgi:hypothetical protein
MPDTLITAEQRKALDQLPTDVLLAYLVHRKPSLEELDALLFHQGVDCLLEYVFSQFVFITAGEESMETVFRDGQWVRTHLRLNIKGAERMRERRHAVRAFHLLERQRARTDVASARSVG